MWVFTLNSPRICWNLFRWRVISFLFLNGTTDEWNATVILNENVKTNMYSSENFWSSTEMFACSWKKHIYDKSTSALLSFLLNELSYIRVDIQNVQIEHGVDEIPSLETSHSLDPSKATIGESRWCDVSYCLIVSTFSCSHIRCN